jgi:hypothetical protein
MDWRNINEHQSYNKVRAELAKRIKPENYGFGPDNWHLKELIQEPTQMGTICMQIIAGENATGKKSREVDYIGRVEFRLKVLSRQACAEANDGKYINGWSAGRVCKHEQRPDNTIFPEHDEPPQEGDVVLIKHGYISGLTPQTRNAMLARGESPIIYERKVVDADGCITCDYDEAHQLLHRAGKRIVFPEYRRPDRSLENAHSEGKGPKPRTITQWHFEEVPADYTKEETEIDAEDSESN